MTKLGSRLREIRELQGLSQAQLARLAKLTPAAICQIENGSRVPMADTLEKICQALEVDVSYFYRDESVTAMPDELSRLMSARGVCKEDQVVVEKFMQFLAHSKNRNEKDEKENPQTSSH